MLKNELNDVRNNLISSDEKLEKVVREHKKLSEKYKLVIKEKDWVESKNDEILKNLSGVRTKLESEKQINEEIRAKLRLTDNKLNEMNKQYSHVMASYSYRIGLIITSLPRAVRKFFHSVKRNSIRNAVKD